MTLRLTTADVGLVLATLAIAAGLWRARRRDARYTDRPYRDAALGDELARLADAATDRARDYARRRLRTRV